MVQGRLDSQTPQKLSPAITPSSARSPSTSACSSMPRTSSPPHGDFAWDDLGSWTALARHLKADPEGNCAVADFIHVDAARNIVYDARTKHRTPIALVGLRDSIVVMADDSTLIAHKSQAQKVKELVAVLAANSKYKKLV